MLPVREFSPFLSAIKPLKEGIVPGAYTPTTSRSLLESGTA